MTVTKKSSVPAVPPSIRGLPISLETSERIHRSARPKSCQARSSSYPSPPMSNPSSPPKAPLESSNNPLAPEDSSPPRSATAGPAPATSSFLPSTSHLPPNPSASFATGFPRPPTTPTSAQFPAHARPTAEPPRTAQGASSPEDVPASRGARKTKAHVASACINCKRAHLSCDVQRPCGRCVASGKQDTCFDVAHKKRGRPRLREEEFRADPNLMPTVPQSALVPEGAPARPIARARHRRTESFRSLRSQASDDSPTWSVNTPTYAPPTPQALQRPPPYATGAPQYVLATAFLDLDLIVIKANGPFEQVMLAGQDVRGQHISEFAAPSSSESFANIRTRLRAERETREPSYMPPIIQPGRDQLPDPADVDVEQVTRGYSDQTYNWTQTRLGAAAQIFLARVRLARASMFYVVVTLPSFRPVEAPRTTMAAPFATGASIPTSDPFGARTQRFPGAASLMPQAPPFSGPVPPYQYPQPHPSIPRPTLEPPGLPTPRPLLPPITTGPPYNAPSFPPPTPSFSPAPSLLHSQSQPPAAATEPPRRHSIQLPSLMPPTTTSQPAEARATSARDDETETGSPRKRRRLGIHDVLL